MHILHMGGFALCVAVGIPVGVAAQERTKISQGGLYDFGAGIDLVQSAA